VLCSDGRADAVVLDALLETGRAPDLVPKLVRGLLDRRRRGHWRTTQEDAQVLLALDRTFATRETETPDLTARVWLGEDLVLEHPFKGRTTERAGTTVPVTTMKVGDPTKRLVIAREGAGRLYYRVALRCAPASFDVAALDRGFALRPRHGGATVGSARAAAGPHSAARASARSSRRATRGSRSRPATSNAVVPSLVSLPVFSHRAPRFS